MFEEDYEIQRRHDPHNGPNYPKEASIILDGKATDFVVHVDWTPVRQRDPMISECPCPKCTTAKITLVPRY